LLQDYSAVGRQILNWLSLGKMRKHCGMTRHQSNGYNIGKSYDHQEFDLSCI